MKQHGANDLMDTWKGWVVDVDVYLEREGADPPFHFETYLPMGANNVITFENHDRGGFLIRYNLRDPHKTGYLFPDDPDEALYSAKGEDCPHTRGQWSQFTAVEVQSENTTLLVKNLNQSPQDFGYTLRVVKDGRWRELDPGGVNQNGNVPFDNR